MHRQLRLAFLAALGFFTVSLCLAAWFRLPLSWDGSAYLFDILNAGKLENRRSFRQSQMLFELPVYWLRASGASVNALSLTYSLTYALIPVGALAFSWWVLPAHRKNLIVWPVLALGLGTVWGQIYFIAESILTPILAWPIVLSVIAGQRKLWAAGGLIFLFFLSPASAFVFLFLAFVLCFDSVKRLPAGSDQGLSTRKFSLIFAALLVAFAILRLKLLEPGYESDQVTLQSYVRSFWLSVYGLPLIGIGLSFAISFLLVRPAQNAKSALVNTMLFYGLAILTLGNCLWWILDRADWLSPVRFRFFAVAVHLCFYIFAWATGSVAGAHAAEVKSSELKGLRLSLMLAALVFTLVIVAQCAAASHDITKLKTIFAAQKSSCVDHAQVASVEANEEFSSLFEHRFRGDFLIVHGNYVAAISILLQNTRVPKRVFLGWPLNCAENSSPDRLTVIGHRAAVLRSPAGWFDLRQTGLD